MSAIKPGPVLPAAVVRPMKSLHAPSLVAGTALLLMAALSAVANFGILENLITAGNTARTIGDISVSEPLFRSGIAALVVVVILDIIVAAALFEVFESVDRRISMVAAWFRLAYSAVFLVAVCRLLEVPALLGADGEQAMRVLASFDSLWKTGLILFAMHLLLIGYLGLRSGFMARAFGILLMLAGLGYLADGFLTVLAPDFPFSFAKVVFVGEVALIFWLLIRGRRTSVPLASDGS